MLQPVLESKTANIVAATGESGSKKSLFGDQIQTCFEEPAALGSVNSCSDQSQQRNQQASDAPTSELFVLSRKPLVKSADIMRSAMYDTSSRIHSLGATICPVNTLSKFFASSQNNCATPIDRIACWMTPTASGLISFQKLQIFQSNRVKSISNYESSTRGIPPCAFDIRESLDSSSDEKFPLTVAVDFEDTLPDVSSPSAMRRNARNLRSPVNKTIVPTCFRKRSPSPSSRIRIQNISVETHNDYERSYALGKEIYAELTRACDDVLAFGVVTCIGGGDKSPLVGISQVSFNRIISKINIGKDVVNCIDAAEESVARMLNNAQERFFRSCAISVIVYNLKNPTNNYHNLLRNLDLINYPCWWMNYECKIPEFLILRDTGVCRNMTSDVSIVMQKKLFACHSIGLSLQSLWQKETLPASWWDSIPYKQRPFGELLLVDVESETFQGSLPIAIDDFCAQLSKLSSELHQALVECWVSSCAATVASLVIEEAVMRNGDSSSAAAASSKPRLTGASSPLRSKANSKSLPVSEWSSGASGTLSTTNNRLDSFNWLFCLLNSASVFMTLQTRSMVELSLKIFLKLFESEHKAFLTSIKPVSRRPSSASSTKKREAVKESEETIKYSGARSIFLLKVSVEMKESDYIVSISPSLEEIKSKLQSCFESIVGAARGVPRLDSSLLAELRSIVSYKPSLSKSSKKTATLRKGTSSKEEELSTQLKQASTLLVDSLSVFLGKSVKEDKPRMSATSQTRSAVTLSLPTTLAGSIVTLEDEICTSSLTVINNIVEYHYKKPLFDAVAHFEKYECVMDGTLANEVEETSRLLPVEDDESEVNPVLEVIARSQHMCARLELMIEDIKKSVADVVFYPLFAVHTLQSKNELVAVIRGMMSKLLDRVSLDLQAVVVRLGQQYQDIATKLVKEPTDSAELKALKDYAYSISPTLDNISKQYNEEAFPRLQLLLSYHHKLAKEEMQQVSTTVGWQSSIHSCLRRSFDIQNERQTELLDLMEEDQTTLSAELEEFDRRVELIAENASPEQFRKIVERISSIKADLDQKEVKAQEISENETLLDLPKHENLNIIRGIRRKLEPLERLWQSVAEFIEKNHMWRNSALQEVNAEEAERTGDEIIMSLIKVSKEFEKGGESRSASKRVADAILGEVREFQQMHVPLMLLVCNPGIRERHWKEISRITSIDIPASASLTLSAVLELNLQVHVASIEDICVSASKEYSLEKALDKMESEWESIDFQTKEYRNTGTRILCSIDDIQQLLDDQIVKVQAMRGSRFIKPFLVRVEKWEKMLTDLQDIIDNWLKMQSTWLYLEPIFSSEDIMRQMPAEGKLFKIVDGIWRQSMAQTRANPSVLLAAKRPGLLVSLLDANNKLEQIQKGLSDYLETKRLAFPRFYFLSNDELLEILAETKDPLRVQPHLKKCFDGISTLEFQKNLDITACLDGMLERVDFVYDKVNTKTINPNDADGNVEVWLLQVEDMMKKSLAYTIDQSLEDYQRIDRISWIKKWQGQVILVVNQLMWTFVVESNFLSTQFSPAEGLAKTFDQLCLDLSKSVELVRGNISKRLRVAIGALVVMDVHNRDTVGDLVDHKANSANKFDWQAQLRYYSKRNGVSAQQGIPGTVECKMINAILLYGYEYLGNNGRLVITPLTDRCYRTLMGAIHLNLGGAPEGPAGTGKTETVKDLGKAIAIQCVVTNCSDGLDYLAMGKFFKGLASAGAWSCFDEFNRIQLEVLSVIAQQILCIQQAKLRKVEFFVFEGTRLRLMPTCSPFITMNPGYAGRAELPDNLKVLFRTVAMMVPDYVMIAEIMLYSYGYTVAKPLAVKIVTTYKLCSEQLSYQCHYDYGMRAVIAVLRAAGNLKRSDGHLNEDVLVLRSIIDVNLPKFLSPDVPLFYGIVSDLFPGVVVNPPDRMEMKTAFEKICKRNNIIPTAYFWEKMVQIYDMMLVRHGFMIVGLPFSGKTSAWKTLGQTLALLHEEYPADSRWSKVIYLVQNPKSISMGQLYGQFDAISHEWTDGVLAINFRNAASGKVGDPEDRKWVLFDGPVDALWIENMNTVLDDNKKLCLMSGEIIAMSDVMSMMFEPMDLLVASPATVSRCGMIYMEPDQMGWKPLLQSWLHFFKEADEDLSAQGQTPTAPETPFTLFNNEAVFLLSLFDWLVEPCLCYVRKQLIEMSPTVDTNLVVSLMNIVEIMLCKSIANVKVKDAVQELDVAQKRERLEKIEAAFVFALIWSIGKSGNQDSQLLFSIYLQEIVTDISVIESKYRPTFNALQLRKWKFPESTKDFGGSFMISHDPLNRRSIYDSAYYAEQNKWKLWSDSLTKYEIPANALYNSIVVPNIYSVQNSFIMTSLLSQSKAILICAPTGTGKSVYTNASLTKDLAQSDYKILSLGFSAKTSAAMTQEIVDSKIDKRRKGIYGPPMGQKAVIFVDDLNMPQVEEYGAQPPIELLRQLMDQKGWYDSKEKTWKSIVDTTIVAAMGPPGGSRNNVTPRFLRHFNLFCFSEFDDDTLKRIFSAIVDWHLSSNSFVPEVKSLTSAIVSATLETFQVAMRELLPTPKKSHYTFNLRDFSRVIQGILLLKPIEGFGKIEMTRLWMHETIRVFGDRLVDDTDRSWLLGHMESMCSKSFGIRYYDAFKHLDADKKGKIDVNDVRRLMFGSFLNSLQSNTTDPTITSNNTGFYLEMTDSLGLQAKIEDCLSEYNSQSKKPMALVMFSFAIEHIARISRILRMPGGNALLVGVGGSGRQSVTRLATYIVGYNLFQIEISKNYTMLEWREDIKNILKTSGCGSVPIVFLFTDTQIKKEQFVEDINNLLNSGEVPNIFPADEKAIIVEQIRPVARTAFGKVAQDMTPNELYAYFISRIRQNMHIVLAFSPIGDAFRDRLRKFPSIINCCTIDWFSLWPQDALIAVSEKFLKDVTFENEGLREQIVKMCQQMHTDINALSEEFYTALKRKTYTTPTSYLELILAFKKSLGQKRDEISTSKRRYETGLEKLAFAADQVNQMQRQLENLQPVLAQSQKDTLKLMEAIQSKLPAVELKRSEVTADTMIAQASADKCMAQKNDVEADLAEALPALEEAIRALDTIKPSDINEVRVLSKPPVGVKRVCESICVMLDIKPNRIPDPDTPGKKLLDYWAPSQRMLADGNFINSLKTYDKDNIVPSIMQEINERFVADENYTIANAAKASKAAEGLCKWVFAMSTYDRVAKIVAPKREELRVAEEALAITMGALNEKQQALRIVEAEVSTLQQQYQAAVQKKQDLEFQVDLCGKKIVRANQLLEGLGGERERWTLNARNLGEQCILLTGDTLISSGVIAYLGPYTAVFREKQVQRWVNDCRERGIPSSQKPTLSNTLGNQVQIRQWIIDGLPTDSFSVENAIVVFNARRWPLMIDPQAQANKWIRNMEKPNNLRVIKLSDSDYLRTLENAIQFGQPILLENVGEELDPSLEPLLLKQIFKQGGVNCIRLGDATVEYSENFRFYITTKLRNPHYLPEISVKVALLNFMITPEGLQDQLLGIVVSEERPDLQEQKNILIVESAKNKKQLKEIEDKILWILSSSKGNILEDETAINTLKESKLLSDDIKEKQLIAEQTEKTIDDVRNSYSPVAKSTQVLFFCIVDLANIEPVYQYSLSWFINLFINAIRKSEKSRDIQKRLKNLDEFFTYSLYKMVCRSLLEKHKLLFSFLLTMRVLAGQGQVNGDEWLFLLTGGIGMNNPFLNPASSWLGDKQWGELCRLSQLEAFQGLREHIEANSDLWKEVYDSSEPHLASFPGHWTNPSSYTTGSVSSSMHRLCLLRALRPDKLALACLNFIVEVMTDKFVKPPSFDLQQCYIESDCTVPLIFILSPGSDPMNALLKIADSMKRTVDAISLGQGQGPIAERLIREAKEKGNWVVLQNCHLAPSWMTNLEKTCEDLDAKTTHEGFRLWCTTYPSDIFPVSVLQSGIKMTNEPPKGLRSNLLGSYRMDPISDPNFFDSVPTEKSFLFRRLVLGLCFFHALVQERRLYGPLGWNIPYEFNESDLRISVRQLQMFIIENDDIPFDALKYTAGECNYGGRVTDDKDRRTLHCILNKFYSHSFLEPGHKLTDSDNTSFVVPDDGPYENYLQYADSIPLNVPPEVFGMHENANITRDQNDTNTLLSSILLTEKTGGSSASGSWDDKVMSVTKDILSKLPLPFDMELAQLRYPVKREESMNTVLCQELIRFNGLLDAITGSLKNLRKALQGLVLMSSELEVVANSLFFNVIPTLWKSRSYPSLKPLASYINDLIQRLNFFSQWLNHVAPPVFWISGFFFTQAFMTGASQNYARKYVIPIDLLVFEFDMMQETSFTECPMDGVYIQGLYVEGARWDRDQRQLAESNPKILFSLAPIIWLKPKSRDVARFEPHYDCPLYKTSDRRGVLSTTGHSTNFICFVKLPSTKVQSHWVLRGVAMLTQLDD